MITNLQLRNLLGAEAKNCTDNELSQIRKILTSLASIECEVYCQNCDEFLSGSLKVTDRIKLLTLAEVGVRIKLNDPKSIKNWVRQNGITVHKLASRNYVYDIDLMICIYRPLILDFIGKYPNNWKVMCQKAIRDEDVFEVIMETIESDSNRDKPLKKIKLRTSEDKKLYRELVA
jgi:hypothetical protein